MQAVTCQSGSPSLSARSSAVFGRQCRTGPACARNWRITPGLPDRELDLISSIVARAASIASASLPAAPITPRAEISVPRDRGIKDLPMPRTSPPPAPFYLS